MNKNQIRLSAFRFLASYDAKIKTKFSNICAKTGQYDVPSELFQKRTPRKNRVLLPWKAVKENKLTIDQLNTFAGGVVVEFVNEDYFLPENQNHHVFKELLHRIGSDDVVSAIISIRSESGSSSSAVQRENFAKLIDNTKVQYKGQTVTITAQNYQNYALERIARGGTGNEKWTGFLFVSIRGGQQDTIETHRGEELLLFNPACEYASEEVCTDLDLVMAYYALVSVNEETLSSSDKTMYKKLISNVREVLSKTKYDYEKYTGDLLTFCDNHPSIKMIRGQLTDPIQVERISIVDFAIDNKEDSRNLDFTHDEAVNKGKFYWDKEKCTILSPARPTNVFWSKHLSNMMQQNFSLEDYFEHEKEISQRRAELLRK